MSDRSSGLRRRRWPRVLLAIALGLLLVLAAATVWWVASFPSADEQQLAAVRADPRVRVVDDGVLSIHPADGAGSEAVVFYAGAAVPPEAYLPTWAPIVVRTGISVHLPSFPLRLPVLAPGRASSLVADHPEVTSWWIGGHSLGGAMAAGHLDDQDPGTYRGLLLFAAYPPGDGLAERDDLRVVSLVGSRDGLSTVEEVRQRRDRLPDDAEVVVLDGVNHAQFGAYGEQRGDLSPTMDDEAATRAIVDAVVRALEEAG